MLMRIPCYIRNNSNGFMAVISRETNSFKLEIKCYYLIHGCDSFKVSSNLDGMEHT